MSSAFNNPLLEWYNETLKPNMECPGVRYGSLIWDLPLIGFINDDLCRRFTEVGFDISDSDPDSKNNTICEWFSEIFARTRIATSLVSESNIDEIAKFSNGWVWEHGAGSGYNSWLLKQKGVSVYSTDCDENQFRNKFTDVDPSIKLKKIKEVIANDGALLYIWPHDYYDLELFTQLGGRKVAVIADNRYPAWNTKGEVVEKHVCPVFPLHQMWTDETGEEHSPKWDCVKKMEVPQYSTEQEDMLRFFMLN